MGVRRVVRKSGSDDTAGLRVDVDESLEVGVQSQSVEQVIVAKQEAEEGTTVAQAPCNVRDNDYCMVRSPSWGTNATCWGAVSYDPNYCNTWSKDLHRCCPESCGVQPVCDVQSCERLGGSGTCDYSVAVPSVPKEGWMVALQGESCSAACGRGRLECNEAGGNLGSGPGTYFGRDFREAFGCSQEYTRYTGDYSMSPFAWGGKCISTAGHRDIFSCSASSPHATRVCCCMPSYAVDYVAYCPPFRGQPVPAPAPTPPEGMSPVEFEQWMRMLQNNDIPQGGYACGYKDGWCGCSCGHNQGNTTPCYLPPMQAGTEGGHTCGYYGVLYGCAEAHNTLVGCPMTSGGGGGGSYPTPAAYPPPPPAPLSGKGKV